MKVSPEKLKTARAGRSPKAVADELQMTRQQIYNYEKGVSVPPIPVLSKLLVIYGVKLNDVLEDTEEEIFISSV